MEIPIRSSSIPTTCTRIQFNVWSEFHPLEFRMPLESELIKIALGSRVDQEVLECRTRVKGDGAAHWCQPTAMAAHARHDGRFRELHNENAKYFYPLRYGTVWVGSGSLQ